VLGVQKFDPEIFKKRRIALCKEILALYPEKENGVILLFAAFEGSKHLFRQESSFFYLTGITEPAAAVIIDVSTSEATVYIPHFSGSRSQWVGGTLAPTEEHAQRIGVDKIRVLGDACKGYQCHPFFSFDQYMHLITVLERCVLQGRALFSLFPESNDEYVEQRFVLMRLGIKIPRLLENFIDISYQVAQLRRKKSQQEVECLYNAILITGQAYDHAVAQLQPGMYEYEIQALVEYAFTVHGAQRSFPTIVASGKQATVLHYTDNDAVIKNNQSVVIDCGAERNYYCADITRTFPSSGQFISQQRDLYMLVLEAQELVASKARPGMWLNNKNIPEQSLHHIAVDFFRQHGYDSYFVHGIGHFLGIDVHDVGDYSLPLQEGDVITIEPGLYIPDQEIGIRIEDNYWIVEDGVVCLSEDIPKDPDDIQDWMEQGLPVEQDEYSEKEYDEDLFNDFGVNGRA
jgi:Xaa-Pro aminopeptidase